MSTVFVNPIIPGFAPDPSVVFTGDTFFLVNSSFHVFPGLPIYASKDLKNWRHIGNAINRKSQLSLNNAMTFSTTLDTGAKLVAATGLFAPTIRYYQEIFYIICTNVSRDEQGVRFQNFYVTTENIWSNQWSDPILIDFQGIDPSLYFDDDNRAYVQGSWSISRTQQPTCTIKQMEINIKTGKQLSEPMEIWPGFTKHDSEGPHVYKKDGYYYLLIAEGGTFEHHMLSIARSTSIWGPYESYMNNPVLTADGTNEYIQNTGHGDLFEDSTGQWWAVMLGVRNNAGHYVLGRETFLAPVSWPAGGWPQIEHPKVQFEREFPSNSNFEDKNCSIEQEGGIENVFIRDPELDAYSFSPDGREITLVPSTNTLSSPRGTASFVGNRQRTPDCIITATVSIDGRNLGRRLNAGIAVYKDDFRHIQLFFDYKTSEICLTLHDKLQKDSTLRRRISEELVAIDLKIDAAEKRHGFHYRTGSEEDWTPLGSMDTYDMTARDFTGPICGVYACGDDSRDASPVTFRSFKVTQSHAPFL